MAGLISSNPDIAMSMDLGAISPQTSDPTDVTLSSVSDELLTDLWIGVVLTAMVLSCIGCLCSCFLYHTFRQWQTRVQEDLEANCDTASLPSYTTVGGLPTYEEAMEQQMFSSPSLSHVDSSINTPPLAKLSVGELLEIYKEGVKK